MVHLDEGARGSPLCTQRGCTLKGTTKPCRKKARRTRTQPAKNGPRSVTHPGHDFYTILQFCPKPVSFFGKNLTAFGGLCGGCSGEGLRMFWSSSEKALGKLWGSSGEAPGKLWGSCGQLWGIFRCQNGYVEHFSGQLADN